MPGQCRAVVSCGGGGGGRGFSRPDWNGGYKTYWIMGSWRGRGWEGGRMAESGSVFHPSYQFLSTSININYRWGLSKTARWAQST